jgi:CheY-like chemotaxis protein
MKNVLIVDDEQVVLEVLQRILNRLGFKTVVTDSGKVALERFSVELFDLVLMDVLMPEKDGFEIAKEMRKIRPEQKIVMITGLGPDASVQQAHSNEITVNDILSKPFSFEKVKHVITNVLNGEKELEKGEIISAL